MSATMSLIQPATKRYNSPEFAAEYLGIKIQTLANWRVEGRGPKFYRVGRLVRYRIEDLEAWIETSNSSAN